AAVHVAHGVRPRQVRVGDGGARTWASARGRPLRALDRRKLSRASAEEARQTARRARGRGRAKRQKEFECKTQDEGPSSSLTPPRDRTNPTLSRCALNIRHETATVERLWPLGNAPTMPAKTFGLVVQARMGSDGVCSRWSTPFSFCCHRSSGH